MTTSPFFALGLPHGLDWLWIALIVFIFIGPKKLPELARGLGRRLGEFKKAKSEFDRELQTSLKEQDAAAIAAAAQGGVSVPPGTVATTTPQGSVTIQKVSEVPPVPKV